MKKYSQFAQESEEIVLQEIRVLVQHGRGCDTLLGIVLSSKSSLLSIYSYQKANLYKINTEVLILPHYVSEYIRRQLFYLLMSFHTITPHFANVFIPLFFLTKIKEQTLKFFHQLP